MRRLRCNARLLAGEALPIEELKSSCGVLAVLRFRFTSNSAHREDMEAAAMLLEKIERKRRPSGVISRLDRNALESGDGYYNHFNTCYYQASAAAMGGSSGSLVAGIDGNAVALQAGGRATVS